MFPLLLKLVGLSLPDHWMKKMFTAAGYMELLLFEDAMMLYSSFIQQGFAHCPYVVSQIALGHYHLSCKLTSRTLIEQSFKITSLMSSCVCVCNIRCFKCIYASICDTVDFQAAIDAFQQLEKLDPYRLTSVDTYSNVLFVKVATEVMFAFTIVLLLYRVIR